MRPRLCPLVHVLWMVLCGGPPHCTADDAWWQPSEPVRDPNHTAGKTLPVPDAGRFTPVIVETVSWSREDARLRPEIRMVVAEEDQPEWTQESFVTHRHASLESEFGERTDRSDGFHSDIPPPPNWHDGSGCTDGESENVFRSAMSAMWQDQCLFYSSDSLLMMALGTAVVSPIANTNADRAMRDWYQDSVRSSATDDFSRGIKDLGYQWDVIPIYVAAWTTGRLMDRWNPSVGETLSTWGTRNLRSLAVGTPPLLFGQKLLGAGRPGEDSSRWSLWDDNNAVSGHAFVGALPLLTAAEMTDSPVLRTLLYAASPAVGMTRINDDAHYFSQVTLGWGLAWIATRAVCRKKTGPGVIQFLPFEPTGGSGVGIAVSY